MDNVNRLESFSPYITAAWSDNLESFGYCFLLYLQPHNVLRKFRCKISLRNINLMTVLWKLDEIMNITLFTEVDMTPRAEFDS